MPSRTDGQSQDTARDNGTTAAAAREERDDQNVDNGHARDAEQREAGRPHTATLRTPFATARLEVPRAPGTSMKVGPVRLPSPAQTAFYLGLGALAVAEVVEWPIAAAIGVGTYVAQHSRGGESASQGRREAPTRGGPEMRREAQTSPDAPAEA
ncbi:hypothetical protein [Frankia sp. Cas4]|uniref:hypothetical protein n=1 Tax=Frankia sp. Cas4 TaxID=3073927 RepID=UPI002AD30BA3|nr:hypothetical protein [Frankia sp. Cas4]